jgi:dethiobiotin synthetase
MRGLFVTGTGTDVGKSVLGAALLAAMAAAGEPVRAHKPVLTGLAGRGPIDRVQPTADSRRPADHELLGAAAHSSWPADHELLGAAAGMPPEEVTPLRYGPAVSPHLAAAMAGEHIDPAGLLAAGFAAASAGTAIVEGVGGLLTPLADGYTVCDYALALGLPVLIAARPGLGTINHTLLTVAAARAAGLELRAVVLTPWPSRPSRLERSNRETIARMAGLEVAGLPRVHHPHRDALARAAEGLPWRRWLRRQGPRAATGVTTPPRAQPRPRPRPRSPGRARR